MKIKNDDVLEFKDALYLAQCPECATVIEWHADFDADGTTYYGRCCDILFEMCPKTVKITIDGK